MRNVLQLNVSVCVFYEQYRFRGPNQLRIVMKKIVFSPSLETRKSTDNSIDHQYIVRKKEHSREQKNSKITTSNLLALTSIIVTSASSEFQTCRANVQNSIFLSKMKITVEKLLIDECDRYLHYIHRIQHKPELQINKTQTSAN